MDCSEICVPRFVVVTVVILLILSAEGVDMNDYTRLKQDLKTGYDPRVIPSQHASNATSVVLGIDMYLRGFQFDERLSLFTLFAVVSLDWGDDRMKWDPARYGNITTMHFAAHEVWKPDFSIYNNYGSDIDHFKNTGVVGFSVGLLVWVTPATFTVGCVADLRRWPYDTQTCKIALGFWSPGGEDIDIRLNGDEPQLGGFDGLGWLENREWRLVSHSLTLSETVNGCCPNSPDVEVILSLTIQRHPSTHTAAVVLPALAIAAAILISFWIRPIATERLALIMFVILINCSYLCNVYLMIPMNGGNVPLVLLYFRDSLFMVSVALLWTIGLRYLAAAKQTSPVPLPGFIQVFLESCMSRILCLDPRPNTSIGSDDEEGNPGDEGKLVPATTPYQADWAWLAHLLDRVAFTIYLIVYFIFAVALLL